MPQVIRVILDNSQTGTSDFDATRQSIYQFADAVFSANLRDINYFLEKPPDNQAEVTFNDKIATFAWSKK